MTSLKLLRTRLLVAAVAPVVAGMTVGLAPPAAADYSAGEQEFLNGIGGGGRYPDEILKLGYSVCKLVGSNRMDASSAVHKVAEAMNWSVSVADTFNYYALKYLCPNVFNSIPGADVGELGR